MALFIQYDIKKEANLIKKGSRVHSYLFPHIPVRMF